MNKLAHEPLRQGGIIARLGGLIAIVCGGGILLTFLAAADCETPVNTNDKTPPQVEIKVKDADGQYVVASSVELSASVMEAGGIDWMCIVSDADGVKSAAITYSTSFDGCTIGSSVWDCFASYQPHPQDETQALAGNADGKVLNELPLLSTVRGPFTCTCPGQGTGVPFGRSIKATCTGNNWSSDPAGNSAQKVLTINLQ